MSDDDVTPPNRGRRWILVHTPDWWDESTPIGAFRSEADAIAVRDALAGTDDFDIDSEYEVEELPILGPLRVEVVNTTLDCSMTVYWNGRMGGERDPKPVVEVRIVGLDNEPDVVNDPDAREPLPVEVLIAPIEQGYTLGVNLRVRGTDIVAVRAKFLEERERILTDPAAETIRAWVASDYLPRWTFGRGENAALAPHLADALRAAGKGELVHTHIDEGS